MKIKILTIIILLCVALCGCDKKDKSDSVYEEATTKKADSLNILEVDAEDLRGVCLLKDDSAISYTYVDEDGISYQKFYRYDLNKNIKYEIGTISDPYIDSGDEAVKDDKMYFYRNKVIFDSNTNETIMSSLYELDLNNDTLKKLAEEDNSDQTFVYIEPFKDGIISHKGKRVGNKGIGYLDIYDTTSKKDNEEFEVLLSKEYDNEKNIGGSIEHFTISGEVIYIIAYERENNEIVSQKIEKYNLEGKKIGEILLDSETISVLKDERVAEFEVFENYAYIVTFSCDGIILDISSDVTEVKFLKESDLYISLPTPIDKQNVNYVMLFSRDSGEVWILDIVKHKLLKVGIEFEGLKNLKIDSNYKVLLISTDDVIYDDITKFPVEEEIDLTKERLIIKEEEEIWNYAS